MIEKENIRFKPILAGKLRRYFSMQNFLDLIKIKLAFWQSFFIIIKEKPSLIMSAGGFVSVPVSWAAWILRVPVIIHQQDVRPGLANKLMAPFARIITTTFEKSLKDYGKKAVWIGNPVRSIISEHKITKREAIQKLGMHTDKPIVLVMGGGTGAEGINDLVIKSLSELTKFCQVIHITGQGKSEIGNRKSEVKDYKVFEFLDMTGMLKVFTSAEVVVSRCGMSTLTELSFLGKPTILIPMPDSHQENNAQAFKEGNATLVLDQKKLTPEKFADSIKRVIRDEELKVEFSTNISKMIKTGASEKIIGIIKGML